MHKYELFWLAVLLLSGACLFSIFGQCIEPGNELRGDVDLNGTINISDAPVCVPCE